MTLGHVERQNDKKIIREVLKKRNFGNEKLNCSVCTAAEPHKSCSQENN